MEKLTALEYTDNITSNFQVPNLSFHYSFNLAFERWWGFFKKAKTGNREILLSDTSSIFMGHTQDWDLKT